MRYYYYPLCTKDFSFENIFSSESVSPTSFYKKRGFGIEFFYKIPKFHHENALLFYNEPPIYETGVTTDTIKFILAIKEDAIDSSDIIFVDEGIIAYQKTVYLTKNNFTILFFSEKEKIITCLKSESSLPTKGLKKFEHVFKIISEDSCKVFDLATANLLKVDIPENEIAFDRIFNYFKGFIYGLCTGIISTKSPQEVKIKRSLQDILNSFAELKNRYENNSKSSENKYAKSETNSQQGLSSYQEKLKTAIGRSEKLFLELFPSKTFSETSLIEFLLDNYNKRSHSLDITDIKKYIDIMILDDEIFGRDNFNQLKNYYIKKSGATDPAFYFDLLRQHVASYLANSKYVAPQWLKKTRITSDENFKVSLYELGKFVEGAFLKKTETRKINLETVNFSMQKNEVQVDKNLHTLGITETDEFVLISNIILQNSKFGKGDANKEQILNIVELVGNSFSKTKGAKESQLYQYLNNEIDAYSLDKVSSVVMKNFVAFVFNPDSIEKLENFSEAKEIEEKWISYSFWCAFNGFANISRNFVKPIFDTSNEMMQEYLDTYLQGILSNVAISSTINEKNISQVELMEPLPLHSTDQNSSALKNKEFFDKYIANKYTLSFELFESIIKDDNKNLDSKEFNKKFKIGKKEGKKIVDSYNEFLTAGSLF